jgi:RpiR family transcriptional regulator, carbohydrate utilization regulator
MIKSTKTKASTPALHRLDLGRLEFSQLSESEMRVTRFVQLSPEKVMHFSMAQLALAAGVSAPTIARFCKNTGFTGFKEFKTWLANAVGAGTPYEHRDVAAGDNTKTVFDIVMQRSMAALAQIRAQTSQQHVDQAVALLNNAHRIECYGMGNSGITAQDAAHKFFRMGIPSIAHADPHIHAVAAAMLTKNDAILAISNSGRSLELLASIKTARQVGAKVIALTPINSPLAKLAHVTLNINQSDDPDLTAPMTTRLCQLALIDVLAVTIAKSRGPALQKRMNQYRGLLEEKRQR